MRVLTGHQPVYLPWLGLIHKASLADVFILMDDVQYLCQDWNNRNRIKTPQGGAIWLTVPVNQDGSKSKRLADIRISEERNVPEHKRWQRRHWKSIQVTYSGAPYFKAYRQFFQWLYLENQWQYLSDLNLAILKQIFEWFEIDATLVIGSNCRFQGKKSDLVLEHALTFDANVVVTGAQGKGYIRFDTFSQNNIKVVVQEFNHPVYSQRFGPFVSHLSFIDLLFHHGPLSRKICMQNNITREELWKNALI